MKVTTESGQIRRRSNTSAFYLHIPWLNYIFFFFQARGGYIAVKDQYHLNREIPSVAGTFLVAFKFSFFGTLYATMLHIILLLVGVSPFGHMAAYYVGIKANFWAGLLPPAISTVYFGQWRQWLHSTSLNWDVLLASVVYMGLTYLIFSMFGAFLARYNLKADIKRNLIPHTL